MGIIKSPSILFLPPTIRYFVGLLSMHHIYCPNKRSFIQSYGQRHNGHSKDLYDTSSNSSSSSTDDETYIPSQTIITSHSNSYYCDYHNTMISGGCVLHGKPGRVVVEGPSEASVRQYLRGVRKLRWQKCVEMGVFPSEEVIHTDILRDRFSFMDEELALVRENKKLHSSIISTSLVNSNTNECQNRFESNVSQTLYASTQTSDCNHCDDGVYMRKRVRPSAHLFPLQKETKNGDFLRVFETEQALQEYLTDSCGAPEVWDFLNRPFSGIRVTNYSQEERF